MYLLLFTPSNYGIGEGIKVRYAFFVEGKNVLYWIIITVDTSKKDLFKAIKE